MVFTKDEKAEILDIIELQDLRKEKRQRKKDPEIAPLPVELDDDEKDVVEEILGEL